MSFFSFKSMFKRAKKLIKSGAILTTAQVKWQHRTLNKVLGNQYGRIAVAAVASFYGGPAAGQAVMAYGASLDAKKAGDTNAGNQAKMDMASAFINGAASYYGSGGGTQGVSNGMQTNSNQQGSSVSGTQLRENVANLANTTTTQNTSASPGFFQSIGNFVQKNPELVKIASGFASAALTPSPQEAQLELEKGRRQARFNTPLSGGLLSQPVPNLAPSQTPLIQAQ